MNPELEKLLGVIEKRGKILQAYDGHHGRATGTVKSRISRSGRENAREPARKRLCKALTAAAKQPVPPPGRTLLAHAWMIDRLATEYGADLELSPALKRLQAMLKCDETAPLGIDVLYIVCKYFHKGAQLQVAKKMRLVCKTWRDEISVTSYFRDLHFDFYHYHGLSGTVDKLGTFSALALTAFPTASRVKVSLLEIPVKIWQLSLRQIFAIGRPGLTFVVDCNYHTDAQYLDPTHVDLHGANVRLKTPASKLLPKLRFANFSSVYLRECPSDYLCDNVAELLCVDIVTLTNADWRFILNAKRVWIQCAYVQYKHTPCFSEVEPVDELPLRVVYLCLADNNETALARVASHPLVEELVKLMHATGRKFVIHSNKLIPGYANDITVDDTVVEIPNEI